MNDILQPARPWSVAEGLQRVLRLIEDPACWLPDGDACFARDASGAPVPATSGEAVRFTWRGAVFRVASSMERRSQIFEALDQERPSLAKMPQGRAPQWSHVEVIEAIRATLAAAEMRRTA